DARPGHVHHRRPPPGDRVLGPFVLPEPMLAQNGALPGGMRHGFELKWDGFRALVRGGDGFLVRSRRGWNMTSLVPELREPLNVDAVLDGELVALGEDGWPSFPLVSRRLLHGERSIPVAFVVFDVLEVDGESVMSLSFRERRRILDEL